MANVWIPGGMVGKSLCCRMAKGAPRTPTCAATSLWAEHVSPSPVPRLTRAGLGEDWVYFKQVLLSAGQGDTALTSKPDWWAPTVCPASLALLTDGWKGGGLVDIVSEKTHMRDKHALPS